MDPVVAALCIWFRDIVIQRSFCSTGVPRKIGKTLDRKEGARRQDFMGDEDQGRAGNRGAPPMHPMQGAALGWDTLKKISDWAFLI